MEDKVHDIESYIITIRRRNSVAPVQTITATRPSAHLQSAEPGPDAVPASKTSGAGKPVTAPLPGVIIDIRVAAGDQIKAGQVIAILEAMKMENEIQAENDGTIISVHVGKGDSVLEGTAIVTIQ